MMASMVCASSTSRFSSSFWGCALCRSQSSSSSFVKLSSEIAMPGLGHQSLGISPLLQPEECFQIIDHASPFWAHGFPLHFVFNLATTASLKASLHHCTTQPLPSNLWSSCSLELEKWTICAHEYGMLCNSWSWLKLGFQSSRHLVGWVLVTVCSSMQFCSKVETRWVLQDSNSWQMEEALTRLWNSSVYKELGCLKFKSCVVCVLQIVEGEWQEPYSYCPRRSQDLQNFCSTKGVYWRRASPWICDSVRFMKPFDCLAFLQVELWSSVACGWRKRCKIVCSEKILTLGVMS